MIVPETGTLGGQRQTAGETEEIKAIVLSITSTKIQQRATGRTGDWQHEQDSIKILLFRPESRHRPKTCAARTIIEWAMMVGKYVSGLGLRIL